MSRAAVRSAITAWIDPAHVAGLSAVFRSRPREILPQAIAATTPGSVLSAGGVVFIEREFEERRSLGGEHSGKKRVRYQIRFELYTQSFDTDTMEAMDAFDALVDAVKARIRADRTLGDNSGVVWQAGEEQLEGEYGEPVILDDSVQIWGAIRFIVSEWLTT